MLVAGSWTSVKKGVNGGRVWPSPGCADSGGMTEEDVVCRSGEGRRCLLSGRDGWEVREVEGSGGIWELISGTGKAWGESPAIVEEG